MAAIQPFSPRYGSGTTISACTSTATLKTLVSDSLNVVLTNTGSKTAYVRIMNDSASSATVADFPVLSNSQVALTKGFGQTKISAVCSGSDTTSLHIISGEGFAR